MSPESVHLAGGHRALRSSQDGRRGDRTAALALELRNIRTGSRQPGQGRIGWGQNGVVVRARRGRRAAAVRSARSRGGARAGSGMRSTTTSRPTGRRRSSSRFSLSRTEHAADPRPVRAGTAWWYEPALGDPGPRARTEDLRPRRRTTGRRRGRRRDAPASRGRLPAPGPQRRRLRRHAPGKRRRRPHLPGEIGWTTTTRWTEVVKPSGSCSPGSSHRLLLTGTGGPDGAGAP